MGSLSVAFHPTQVNTLCLNANQSPVLDSSTPEGVDNVQIRFAD